ncbi:uncharacterized protein LOC112692239 [Sipha flava]|uniref:ATP-dependent DNA helicase n=1 Tax=Sipha flava TaxID=143950 RepID=A0A8B8GI90_9HEMI|nr:uncharacterized protein LOC112692239 [Sipha flava]
MSNIETPTCNISKNLPMAKVLQQCKLIVWDECTMVHKKSLETLDRTLKDLRNNQNQFGGEMILLSEDFRRCRDFHQKLPVVPRSTKSDELNACLKSSNLWNYVNVLHLSKNMRVMLKNDQSRDIFSKQLIDIGNGKFPIDVLTGIFSTIDSPFPRVFVDDIPGKMRTYKSVDTATNENDVVNYPPEFLNLIGLLGLPPHNLQLKVGDKKLLNNVIEVIILEGKYKGEDVLILRIAMIPSKVPFEFKRLQFSVRLAFAMTLNKSQGHSLSFCGIYLENLCFLHGQLYVACSRVGKPSALFVYAPACQRKNNGHLKMDLKWTFYDKYFKWT